MTCLIGPLQPAEVPAFCDLFHRVFSVTLTPEAHHWKYRQGPRLGSLSLVARDSSGVLMGHVGALVFPGVRQGRPLPMAQVCDVMVAPDARGGVDPGGVYGRLMAALQAELSTRFPGVFAYGFAGIRPYKLGARMGLYRVVQPCRLGFFQSRGLTGQAPIQGRVEASLAGHPSPSAGWFAPWTVRAQPVDWAALSWDALWQRIGKRFPGPVVERSTPYLRWRYAQHPQHRYQAWELRRWGRAQGWVVTRQMPDGNLCMVDSLLPQGMEALQAAALLASTHGRSTHVLAASEGAASALSPPVAFGVGSWDIQTETSAALEPIMGCEVKVDRWHSDHVTPRFQPGDTDVF